MMKLKCYPALFLSGPFGYEAILFCSGNWPTCFPGPSVFVLPLLWHFLPLFIYLFIHLGVSYLHDTKISSLCEKFNNCKKKKKV